MKLKIKKNLVLFTILCCFITSIGIMKPAEVMAKEKINSDNLLINPGFEMTTAGNNIATNWTPHGVGNFSVDTTLVSGGIKAQKISMNNLPEGQFAGVSQTIQVKSGQSFSMNGRFFIENISNAKVQLYADFYNAGAFVDSKVFDMPVQATGQFVTLGGNGVVPNDATSVVVYALIRSTFNNGYGTFIADNLSFRYTNDNNLLVNADYESFSNPTLPNSDDWEYTSSYNPSFSSVAYPSLSGARAQKISVKSLPVNGYDGIYQKIKVDSGKNFQISGSLLINDITNAKAQIYIDFLDSTGKFVGTTIIDMPK